MSQGVQLIVFPVKDIARAKTLYRTLLGAEPYADAPYYVGFKVGDQEIGLDPNGHRQGLTDRSHIGRSRTCQDQLRSRWMREPRSSRT